MARNKADIELLSAAKRGNASAAMEALHAGADVNRIEVIGRYTALHFAAETRNIDLARILIEAGASYKAKDRWKRTPLHWAARGGRTSIASLLIDHGADVNAPDKSKKTPLHLAAEFGNLETVRLLLANGAKADATDKKKLTPLDYASRLSHGDLVEALQDFTTLRR